LREQERHLVELLGFLATGLESSIGHNMGELIESSARKLAIECAEPLYRKSRTEGVYEFFVRRHKLRAGSFGESYIKAIVETTVEFARYFERRIKQGKARNRWEPVDSYLPQPNLGFRKRESSGSRRLPEHISNFSPEKIGNDDVLSSSCVIIEQSQGGFGVWFEGGRQDPLRGYTRVHHDAAQRSRSSRIISSVEGN
jgi:hypothetical protein